jgi:hypothetical protein
LSKKNKKKKNTNQHITSTASIFLFCKAPDGEGVTVGDVREWLRKVDDLKLPEDTEVEGALFLNIDYEDSLITRISCGECIPDCNHEDVLVEIEHRPL